MGNRWNLAIVAGWCLLGGEKRIVKVTSKIVPTMGIAYVGISILVIILNAGNLPMVFGTIFAEAFNFKAIFAGFGASVLMQGIKRGLYSNEAGIGSAQMLLQRLILHILQSRDLFRCYQYSSIHLSYVLQQL